MEKRSLRLSEWWNNESTPVLERVGQRTQMAMAAYRENPLLIAEHANIEISTAQGGYGHRQIYELVQNGADALSNHPGGRIHVLLTDSALYCANEGVPVDLEGVDSLLASHISEKRGFEIGRFGLGFKSVLGVSSTPEFFGRSGAFRFDASRSREILSRIAPHEPHFPVLRLAWPMDPIKEAMADPVLSELMTWATTIIRLQSETDSTPWLATEIEDFPAPFLLFSTHVGSLTLEDRRRSLVRTLEQHRDGDELVLSEPGSSTRWRVFSTDYRPSAPALADAGELSRREEVPLVWAVPTSGRLNRGRFWAFFPTEYETTLSGIINAPWKTNEDRQNLLRGKFNEELLLRVAALVVESIPNLVKEEDPGWFLDVLPARGREAPSWADELITEEVYRVAGYHQVLPDQYGVLQFPENVRLHPEGLSSATVDAWASHPGRPAEWCHPGTNTRERYPRAARLLGSAGKSPEHIAAWLEALVVDGTPEASVAALKIAAKLLEELAADEARKVVGAAIVLTEDLGFTFPDPNQVFLPGDYQVRDMSTKYVHGDVVKNMEANRALKALGIGQVDVLTELRARIMRRPTSQWSDADWDAFWALARQSEPIAAAELIRRYLEGLDGITLGTVNRVKVKTKAGQYHPIADCLLPGAVVPADGSRDPSCTMDSEFHMEEMELLRLLGAVHAPTVAKGVPDEPWFLEYKKETIGTYLGEYVGPYRRPRMDLLKVDGPDCVRPLAPLTRLSAESKVELTRAALGAMGEAKDWGVSHSSRPNDYPYCAVPNPALWYLRKAGWLKTSLGLCPVNASVGPTLKEWSRVLPVADISATGASQLQLPTTEDEVPRDLWEAAVESSLELDDDDLLARLYSTAARFLPKPRVLRSRVGASHASLPATDVTVVQGQREFRALIDARKPVLWVPDAANRKLLLKEWGLLPPDLSVSVRPQYLPVGPELLLVEEFPALGWLRNADFEKYQLVRCVSLVLEITTATGRRSEDVEFYVEGQKCLASEALDSAMLLEELNRHFTLELSPHQSDEILENRKLSQQASLVADIRRCVDDAERVAMAIGGEALRMGMPAELIEAVAQLSDENLDEITLGRLALAIYGVSVLKEFREAQIDNGLVPPVTWAGSSRAVQYVRELGFPREYAGWEQVRLPEQQIIDGPSEMPEMHNYQRAIADGIKALLARESSRRGVLALPTGSGKTRIAVQALVEAIAEGAFRGPVLWVAQTVELCEQAVQAWAEVWRSIGPSHRLMISRLWSSNETQELTDGTQVVVATIAKLGGCIKDSDYDWLKETKCLLIDEAHSSTEPSYTQLLEWLGLGRGRGDGNCALIGLTATPFRGVSEEETKRLVARYGGIRLDIEAMGEVTYIHLQDRGVLARVDHQLLPGASITLTLDELKLLQQTRRLPSSALSKVGADLGRNLALLQSIRSLPDDWPILLFAASVDHARTMAALLATQGISSAAISADTDPSARRHYIESFRSGRLRVLTNYQVLTQGFDAPSVRALFIARPTYSPNLYQQMVGRGLRGPLNGGKERCLVVNVEDNFQQYGEKLAFNEFDYLWSGVGHADN